jgi:hypothetical protein
VRGREAHGPHYYYYYYYYHNYYYYYYYHNNYYYYTRAGMLLLLLQDMRSLHSKGYARSEGRRREEMAIQCM